MTFDPFLLIILKSIYISTRLPIDGNFKAGSGSFICSFESVLLLYLKNRKHIAI